jgi:hypothetical protein
LTASAELERAAADEILAAIAATLAEHVDVDPVLDFPREFTKRDRDAVLPQLAIMDENKVERELGKMVRLGVLAEGFRYDPRTKKRAKAYWLAT